MNLLLKFTNTSGVCPWGEGQHTGSIQAPGFACCRLFLSHRVWSGLSHHLSRPTLQLLQTDPLRPGADKNPPAYLLGCFTDRILRPCYDRINPDKPPQFTTVVGHWHSSLSADFKDAAWVITVFRLLTSSAPCL